MSSTATTENPTPKKAKPKKIGRTVLAKYFHDNGYESIPPHVFYREIFPQGELAPFHEDGSYDPTVLFSVCFYLYFCILF